MEPKTGTRSTDSEGVMPIAKSISVSRGNWQRPLLAGLLIAVVVLALVAMYQQQQIATLNRELDANSVVINGTRYCYLSVPIGLPNGTSIVFHGVTFTYLRPPIGSYSDPHNYVFSGSVRLSNGTLLNLTGKSVMIEVANGTAIAAIGVIATRFQDGSREVYDKFSITAAYSSGDLSLPRPHINLDYAYQPVVNPWFTQHENPRAGVFWNYTDSSSTLAFYVSVNG